MSESDDGVRIDLITDDPHTGELVIYLVEEGPWPTADDAWRARLQAIENRVLDAFNVAVDGQLSERFPDSRGKPIRIQIDSPSGSPEQVERLVDGLQGFIEEENEFSQALAKSPFVGGLRITTGHRLGRFQSPGPKEQQR